MTVAVNYALKAAAGEPSSPVTVTASVTPLIGGASPVSSFITNGRQTLATINPTVAGTVYGVRETFSAPLDFTTHDFIVYALRHTTHNIQNRLDTFANRGWITYFVDGSGNYAGFTGMGGDLKTNVPNGNFSFAGNRYICVDRASHTPDAVSGTVDWSDIVAVETHVRVASGTASVSFGSGIYMGYSRATLTGTTDLDDLTDALGATAVALNGWTLGELLARSSRDYDISARALFVSAPPITVGDGTTATTFSLIETAFGARPRLSDFADVTEFWLRHAIFDAAQRFTVNQSASCVFTATDFAITAASGLIFEIIGSASATATLTRGFVKAPAGVTLNHAQATEVTFYEGVSVTATAATGLVDCIVRDMTQDGLILAAAPGDYSALTVRFRDNTGVDLTIDPASAGTFDLSGVTVPSGYTLKVHNASATHAITVTLAAGITATTTTAGGAITVQSPPVTITAPNLIDGTRVQIYNATADAEIDNSVVSGGAGYSFSVSGEAAGGDLIRLRAAYQSGADHRRPIEQEATFNATTGASFPQSQTAWAELNAIGVDGSTFASVLTVDFLNAQVVADISGGTIRQQDLVAFYAYHIATATGIQTIFGLLNPLNEAECEILETAPGLPELTIRNANATPLRITDTDYRLYSRAGNARTASGGGGIDWEQGNVFIKETGVSGLTAAESAALLALPTIATIERAGGLLEELHRMRGLNADAPVTVTETEETAGDITLDVTGDGETTSTLTRAA